MLAALNVQPFAATQLVFRGLAQSGLGPSHCAATPLPFMLVVFVEGMLAEFEWAGPLLPGAVAGKLEGTKLPRTSGLGRVSTLLERLSVP